MAKRLFYVSAAILCLTLAYHFGAQNAVAQANAGNGVVAAVESSGGASRVVVTANGDVYESVNYANGPWILKSNVFAGAPTPVQQSTFGGVKARYR